MLIFFFCFACVVLCIFIVAKNIYIYTFLYKFSVSLPAFLADQWTTDRNQL